MTHQPSHSFRSLILATTILGLLAGNVAAQSATQTGNGTSQSDPPPTKRDIAYGTEPGQTLNFWAGKSADKAPLLVYIPGGAWQRIDGRIDALGRCKPFWDHGFAVAMIQYRLAPENPLPVPVMDAARAVQFLRHHAKDFNFDPNRVVLLGMSAGGCSALWLATHDDVADPTSDNPILRESSKPQVVVAGMAQTTIVPAEVENWVGFNALRHGMVAGAGGYSSVDQVKAAIEKDPAVAILYRKFSPIHQVSADDPPILLEYGGLAPAGAGDIHDGAFGIRFHEAAKRVGARYHLSIYKNESYPPYPGGAVTFVTNAMEGNPSHLSH